MNNKIMSLLEQINDAKKIIKKTIYRSCDANDGDSFSVWCSERFKVSIPALYDFVALSKKANGLNYNGLFVYSLNQSEEHNIYDSNEEWWDNDSQKKYLFFADDDTSWYCFDTTDTSFWVLDKPSGEKMIQCGSLIELMILALETALK